MNRWYSLAIGVVLSVVLYGGAKFIRSETGILANSYFQKPERTVAGTPWKDLAELESFAQESGAQIETIGDQVELADELFPKLEACAKADFGMEGLTANTICALSARQISILFPTRFHDRFESLRIRLSPTLQKVLAESDPENP